MEKAEKSSEYMTLREMANCLGVTYSTVRTQVLPKLKHIRIGDTIRVRREEFHHYLKFLERGGDDA